MVNGCIYIHSNTDGSEVPSKVASLNIGSNLGFSVSQRHLDMWKEGTGDDFKSSYYGFHSEQNGGQCQPGG